MKILKMPNKKIIFISITICIICIICIGLVIYNSNSYKLYNYLKQNYNYYVEFKNNGYILVKKQDKYGILDYSKNEIYNCIYDNVEITQYRDEYLMCLKGEDKYILLNSKLEEIITSNNRIVVYANEGYAQTWLNDTFE